MKTKDSSVDMKLHPVLTQFLFAVDELYRTWEAEAVITSGSEMSAKHSRTSLHYGGAAVDIRSWALVPSNTLDVIKAGQQHLCIITLRDLFCKVQSIPADWIDIVLESDHIHIEYQPKRVDNLLS